MSNTYHNIRPNGLATVADSTSRLAFIPPNDGYTVVELDTHALWIWNASTQSWVAGGGSGGGVQTYPNLAAFPATAADGTLAIALDTHILYEYNAGTTSWMPIGGPTGNLTSTDTTNLAVNNGTGAVLGSGTSLTLTGASLVEATSSVLTLTGATNAVLGTGVSIAVKQSSTSQNGYLSSTDWNTFNGKQPSGSYITALTGDVTASGPGSATSTLATVNTNTGSFGSLSAIPNFTTNAKGLITAAGSTSSTSTPTASSFAGWDANANIHANGYIPGYTTTATAAGTTALLVTSPQVQTFTGTTTQIVTLPTTGVTAGLQFLIQNRSTGVVTVNASAGGVIQAMASNTDLNVVANSTAPTTAAGWDVCYYAIGVVPVALGGTASTTVTSTPTITHWAGWDGNKNMSANNHIAAYTTTATAAGTTVITVGSTYQQYFTGATTQTLTLPVASTLVNGQGYSVTNLSTGVVTVQTSGANTLQAMAAGSTLLVTCINSAGGTGTASWGFVYNSTNSGAVVPVPGDIVPTTWAGLLNNTAAQTVTGLAFATTVSTFTCLMDIAITATTNTWTQVIISGTRRASADWSVASIQAEFVGDAITGLAFDITSAGQVTASIGSITGYVSGSTKFRAQVLS